MKQTPSLEDKTHSYWSISSAFHQRPEVPNIAVGDAITHLSDAYETTNPTRPLAQRVFELQGELINGTNINEREAQAK